MENTNVPVISAKDLNLWYGDVKALKSIDQELLKGAVAGAKFSEL